MPRSSTLRAAARVGPALAVAAGAAFARLPAAPRPEPGAAPVAAPASSDPACDVLAMPDAGAPPADTQRARAACEAARARFAELFGAPVPGVQIVLEHRPGYRAGVRRGRAILFWPTSRAMAERAGVLVGAVAPDGAPPGSDGATDDDEALAAHIAEQWRDVLPHEIAHALLSARFFEEGADARPGGYGTPFPDWFDEGVAIWAESPGHRAARVAQARALPESLRALPGILAAKHPAADDASILRIRDGAPIPADRTLWTFYPRSIAVVAFVYDAGGRDAVLALARRLAAAPSAPPTLAGLPGLPAAEKDVVAAWERWLDDGADAAPAARD
ncbi:MAG TPA: hypothetical protein VF212_08475 [Longimicrobiales bacterium]